MSVVVPGSDGLKQARWVWDAVYSGLQSTIVIIEPTSRIHRYYCITFSGEEGSFRNCAPALLGLAAEKISSAPYAKERERCELVTLACCDFLDFLLRVTVGLQKSNELVNTNQELRVLLALAQVKNVNTPRHIDRLTGTSHPIYEPWVIDALLLIVCHRDPKTMGPLWKSAWECVNEKVKSGGDLYASRVKSDAQGMLLYIKDTPPLLLHNDLLSILQVATSKLESKLDELFPPAGVVEATSAAMADMHLTSGSPA